MNRNLSRCVLLFLLVFLISSLLSARSQTLDRSLLNSPAQLKQTEESVPPSQTEEPEELPLFGRNLFVNWKPLDETFIYGSGMFPDNYRLGPGDRLGIYLLGKDQRSFDVIVNVEGKVFIPTVGVLYANNLKIEEFQDALTKELNKYYDNFSVSVMLIQPKRISVTVAGDVNKPGKYFLSSLNTVLDAVLMASGPTDIGSLRNVELYRDGERYAIIDLYQFLMQGKIKDDVFLQANDKIVVPLIDAVVTVDGEVKRPARFELKILGHERISDLIQLAGGFTDMAYLNKIEISRLLPNGERFVRYIDYREILADDSCSANLLLQNNDQIHVFSIMDQGHRKYVYIHGEVKRPGIYPFEENLHVTDLLLKAGNLTRSAYMLECEVAKIDPKTPTKFIKIDLNNILNDSECEENILLEEDDRVFIRRIPEWEVGPVVEIKGEVQFPGIYAITEDSTTLSEVMEKAGGFTDDALIREASLIRKSSKITIDKEYMRLKQIPRDQLSESEYQYLVMKENTQDIGRIVVDFYKLCILHDKTEDVTLEDGDIINIPRAPKVVYVTGRVSRSGGVLFEKGKSIKYYLKKAGGVTWDAKTREIKVTKVSGEILDDEEVKELTPGDIIWVPRKPDRDWWEIFRQTIAVIAQVATVYLVVDRAIVNK